MERDIKRLKVKITWDLPRLVWDRIMQKLSVHDILRLGTCSKYHYKILQTKRLWVDLLKRDFGDVKWGKVDNPTVVYKQEFNGSIALGGQDYSRIFLDSIYASSRCLDLVHCALRRNIDPSVNHNFTIMFAAAIGQTEAVKLLLADPRVNPGSDDNRAIREAAMWGRYKIVELLLADPRVDPGASENDALSEACASGYIEIVKLLLADPRVDPTDSDDRAIREACRYGHVKIVKLLLQNVNVDPTVFDNYPMKCSVKEGYHKVVELLIQDERINPNFENDWAIRHAAKYGHIRVVIFIVFEFVNAFLAIKMCHKSKYRKPDRQSR